MRSSKIVIAWLAALTASSTVIAAEKGPGKEGPSKEGPSISSAPPTILGPELIQDLNPFFDGNLFTIGGWDVFSFGTESHTSLVCSRDGNCDFTPNNPPTNNVNGDWASNDGGDTQNDGWGDDNGGDNPNGGDHKHHKHERVQCVRHHHSHDKWAVAVSPILFVESSSPTLILAKEGAAKEVKQAPKESKQSPEKISLVQASTPSPRLQISAVDGGYAVQKRSSLQFGVGAKVSVHPIHSGAANGVAGYIGILPIVGSDKLSERSAYSLKEAEEMKDLELDVPTAAQDVLAWRTGDRLTYSASGGVLFMAGIGYYALTVGTTYLAQGSWEYQVEKTSDDEAYVKVTKSKLNSLGLLAAAGIIEASTAGFQNVDDSFSFGLNLRSAQGAAALELLLQGDLTQAQSLADSYSISVGGKSTQGKVERTYAVRRIENAHTLARGHISALKIGIPYLSWAKGSTDMIATRDVQNHIDGSLSDYEFGVYLERTDARLFKAHESASLGFAAVDEVQTRADKSTARFENGTVAYSYWNNSTNSGELRRAIEHLVRRTGLKQELALDIPDSDDVDVRSARVDFELSLGAPATENLLRLASAKDSATLLSKIALDFCATYFKRSHSDLYYGTDWSSDHSDIDDPPVNDPWGLCKDVNAPYYNCAGVLYEHTTTAVGVMVESAAAMSAARTAGDRKAFVAAYARFGKAMLENPFTFQTALGLLKGQGVKARFSVQTTAYKPYSIAIDWAPATLK